LIKGDIGNLVARGACSRTEPKILTAKDTKVSRRTQRKKVRGLLRELCAAFANSAVKVFSCLVKQITFSPCELAVAICELKFYSRLAGLQFDLTLIPS